MIHCSRKKQSLQKSQRMKKSARELIDLRTQVALWTQETIVRSVKRQCKLLIIDEGHGKAGINGEIAARGNAGGSPMILRPELRDVEHSMPRAYLARPGVFFIPG